MTERRARLRGVTVAFLCIALAASVLSACKSGPESVSVSVIVKAGSSTSTTVGGVRLRLGAGAEPTGTDVKLTVTPDPSLHDVPKGIDVLGPYVEVTPGGQIDAPATVTFAAPPSLDRSKLVPVVVWSDSTGGWRWVRTSWVPGRTTVTGATSHFSGGFLGGIDIARWAHDRENSFRNYVLGRHNATQPTCGDEAAARTNDIVVRSDPGDRVKWCYGLHDGAQILKITNNLRTFAQVSYPASWNVVRDNAALSISNDGVARAVGTAVETAPGTHSSLVDGGDTLTLNVPFGATGVVRTEMSIAAWALSGIFFGADAYRSVAESSGREAASAASSAYQRLKTLVATGQSGDKELSAYWECLHQVRDLTGSYPHIYLQTLKVVLKCVPGLMEALVKNGSIEIDSHLVHIVTTAVSLVLSAFNLLVSGAREVVDEIASLWNHNSPFYRVVVAHSSIQSSSPVPAPTTAQPPAGHPTDGPASQTTCEQFSHMDANTQQATVEQMMQETNTTDWGVDVVLPNVRGMCATYPSGTRIYRVFTG